MPSSNQIYNRIPADKVDRIFALSKKYEKDDFVKTIKTPNKFRAEIVEQYPDLPWGVWKLMEWFYTTRAMYQQRGKGRVVSEWYQEYVDND